MMYTLSELQEIIKKAIEQEKIGREPISLYDPINYTLQAGGKESDLH